MKSYKTTLLILSLLVQICPMPAKGQAGSNEYGIIMQQLYANKNLPAGELVLKAALLRQGTPYVAGTLETEPEQLQVNIGQTDCILFVESCLALAQTAKSRDTSYIHFCNQIQNLRYRNGKINGYPSRLHYTSEWILQGEKNGFLKEVSKEIAETPLNQTFSFMSSHTDRYKQLSGNPENAEVIKQAEQALNQHLYYYIPKEKVPQYTKQIQPGDIIGFCTSVSGLDLSHVGIAIIDRGQLTFIHASMSAKKVIIEPQSLVSYINSIKSNIGIRIIRPL